MARSRIVKPEFFTNEDLSDCTPWARLLYIGLWTLADREGRLEDRPKRIKAAVFPHDNLDINPLLVELCKGGFIARYPVENLNIISVLTFKRHQRFHPNEKPSTLPSPQEVDCARVSCMCNQGDTCVLPRLLKVSSSTSTSTSTYPPIPPSGGAHTADAAKSPHSARAAKRGSSPDGDEDNGNDAGDHAAKRGKSLKSDEETPAGFTAFWNEWPKHFRKKGRSKCVRIWRRMALEARSAEIVAAVKRFKASPGWRERNGQFIPGPEPWLNDEAWEVPAESLRASEPPPEGGNGFERGEVTPELIALALGKEAKS